MPFVVIVIERPYSRVSHGPYGRREQGVGELHDVRERLRGDQYRDSPRSEQDAPRRRERYPSGLHPYECYLYHGPGYDGPPVELQVEATYDQVNKSILRSRLQPCAEPGEKLARAYVTVCHFRALGISHRPRFYTPFFVLRAAFEFLCNAGVGCLPAKYEPSTSDECPGVACMTLFRDR